MPPRDGIPNPLEPCLSHGLLQRRIRPSPVPPSPRLSPSDPGCASPCWKLSRARSILGISTHVYSPNSNTACTTALKKLPDTLAYAPFRHSIRDRRPQLFRVFYRLPATAGQSSSHAVITHPRYLKDDTVSSCFPQASKSLSVIYLNSESAI